MSGHKSVIPHMLVFYRSQKTYIFNKRLAVICAFNLTLTVIRLILAFGNNFH